MWISGRRGERLDELSEQLSAMGASDVQVSVMDVRDRDSVRKAADAVASIWGGLDLLVNNAGLALGMGTIDEGDWDDWDDMIDTNIKGLLYVTRSLLPLLKAQGKGHIVNMGSTAGKMVYQGGNVYCATKFAVDALSQSMRVDLLPYNIKVTSINPGMAVTEFSVVRFKGDQEKADNAYNGYIPLEAKDIADAVYYCASLPPHVCINDLTITCLQQANSVYKLAR